MNRCLLFPESLQNASPAFDLEIIAQRVLKLAEIAMLEHVEGLARSQAMGLALPHDARQLEQIGG